VTDFGLMRMGEKIKPLRLICEKIDVCFDEAPILEKKPSCPNRFVWDGKTHHIAEELSEWRDYSRKGRMSHNMRPEHLTTAKRRGSWGVGRYYFRVRTTTNQIFDLYYDRAPKGVSNRKGTWTLYREMTECGGEQSFS